MLKTIRTTSIHDLPTWLKITVGVLVFLLSVLLFSFFPPPSIDWRHTFRPVSQVPLEPYSIKTFVNLPWTTLLLYPLQFFSEHASLAINASLNLLVITLLVIKRKGSVFSLALTLTSLPFLSLLANGSLEWIPALGFIFQNSWGVVLILAKPQSGILATLAWFLRSKNKLYFILPSLLVIVLSFLLWDFWPADLIANVRYMTTLNLGLFTVSISPWPWAIPIGVGLVIYMLVKKPGNSELLGALATLCLVPYFVPHSLTIAFALLSLSHRRLAILAWVFLWGFQIVSHWSTFTWILGVR